MLASNYSHLIKREAQNLGFSFCGISKADFLEKEALYLEKYLSKDYHGEMSYMANHFDKRLDPRKLVEGSKSVVSLGFNYYTHKDPVKSAPKVSKYAYGEDYHHVLKDKLKALLTVISEKIGKVEGRAFVDSAPVMERAWAQKSGLGWIGKNTHLINKNKGSFFFLAELILDLDLEPDTPLSKDYCGTCTRCIDACPTQAIVAPYQLDARKCISYLTIELKEGIPSFFSDSMQNWVFGCDVCQDVCPWNRFSVLHQEPRFEPSSDFLQMDKNAWLDITEEVFDKLFAKSPLKRAKYNKIKQTLSFIS